MKAKSTYEERAIKFAKAIAPMFVGCKTCADFENAIFEYNCNHKRRLVSDHGVSRIAIMRADYVIKYSFKPEGRWSDGSAGDNESEQRMYKLACEAGMEHLLAKTTLITIKGRKVSIMPRINHVGDDDRWWGDYVNGDEYDWMSENLNDLHCYNVGYFHGKPVVIDYAME